MVEKLSNILIVTLTRLLFIKQINGIDNLPDKGPYIVVANHASYFDHFIILTLLKFYKKQNVYFMTKKEAFDSYLSRKWHLAMGAIPINREATDTSAFKAIIRTLKENKIICIYPEGTRSPTGKLYEGKQGAIRIAMNAQVPIVPIGLEGTFDILPRRRFWPNFHKTTVNIGKYFKVEQTKDREQLNKIHKKTMNEICILSKNVVEEICSLPEDEGLYMEELLNCANTWNERAIRQYPNDFLTPKKLHKRSIYICDEVLKAQPSNSKAYFEKARAIGRLGLIHKNIVKKISYLRKARFNLQLSLKLDPNFAPSYYALGVWHMEMPKFIGGNPKKALNFYKMADKLESEIYIKIGLAKSLLELGETNQAKKILVKMIKELTAKSNVDSRRKLEALAIIMRMDPNFKLEDRMMNQCLQNSQSG